MASKSKKGASSPLDLAMSAFAACSVGFVVYVMPNASFERAVELSGLPLILPAASPPLGMIARLAAVAVAAIGVFVLVALVLRALGKSTPRAQPERRSAPVEIEVPLPKIRRADAHPDAPARRPILAGLDLGAPFDAETFSREREIEEEALPLEEHLQNPLDEEQEEEAAPFEDQLHYPAAQELETAKERPLPSFIVPQEEEAEADEPYEPDTSAAAFEASEPADDGQGSIPNLMQRLELGLARRQGSSSHAATPFSRPEAGETANQMDHRLRSAIDDLQKLAGRGG
jgi:hypothetical protein